MTTEMSRRGLLSASAMGAAALGTGLAPPGAQAQTQVQTRAPAQAAPVSMVEARSVAVNFLSMVSSLLNGSAG